VKVHKFVVGGRGKLVFLSAEEEKGISSGEVIFGEIRRNIESEGTFLGCG